MSAARLEDRRRAELRSKLSSIGAEFEYWRDASAKGALLRKHNSQIQRITQALAGLADRIEQDLDDAKGDTVLGRSQKIERGVLDLHRLWDYFRSKLALRYVTWFQQPLYAVDELAWACYDPIQRAVAPELRARLKEPPLTFFNGAWSPYAAGRGRAYAPEAVDGALLTLVSAHDAIRKLPIPVVGVPWYLAQHLSDSPVVCHEVGHAVEDDFGLEEESTAALETALESAAVPQPRREAWRSWRGEVFADAYGCLGTGPAFVSALMGFLAGDPRVIAQQKLSSPGWGKYPTTSLRVELNLTVLRQLGHDAPADDLRGRWARFYDGDPMTEFHADMEVVADALLGARFAVLDYRPLQDILNFNPVRHEKAGSLAKDLLVKKAPEPADVRAAHAAARLAFDCNPEQFVAAGGGPRVIAALWGARDAGVRRGAPARPLKELAEADRRLGSELYETMTAAEEE